MSIFRIGHIDGRWNNFLPPIQGGIFRKATDGDDIALKPRYVDDSGYSSQSDSPPHSPLFDSIGGTQCSRRQSQHPQIPNVDTSSVSSVSSEDMDSSLHEPKLALKDAYTQQEIDLDLAKYPPLDPITQDNIIRRYRSLHNRLDDEGLFHCNYSAYLIEIIRYTILLGMCLTCLRWGWYGTSGLFLGLFWHQLVFTAHDAGHMGITHDFATDTIIGIIIADFLGGLSLGWWKRNHNVHHIVTNSPEHDPDIEHMPLFAISHRFFDSLRSSYYDRIMNRLIWEYLLLGLGPKKGPAWWHRWFEIAGHIFFWAWYGYGIVYRSIPSLSERFLFIMVSHMVTGPLHVQNYS